MVGRAGRKGAALPRAFVADTLRTVRGSLKRFLSIAAICVLGTTMLIGLVIACEDLRLSADEFFDAQRLYDISVQSTLGLTDDDVAALAALDGVESAEGSWGETAYTEVAGARSSVSVQALMSSGTNTPYLLEGRLPQGADEVAVTREYLEDTGKQLGDTLAFGVDEGSDAGQEAQDDADTSDDEDDAEGTEDSSEGAEDSGDLDALDGDSSSTELFARRSYTITGTVVDPTSTAAKNGSSSFRATGARYTFFVTAQAATSNTYSVIYLRVAGAGELSGFSDAYEARVAQVTAQAEALKGEREEARTAEVRAQATDKVDDAETEANEELADAEAQLAGAQRTIDDARTQIASGRDQLAAQGASARQQLADAQAKLDASRQQLSDSEQLLKSQRTQAKDAIATFEQGYAQAAAGADELRAALGDAWPADEWQAVLDARTEDEASTAVDAFDDAIGSYASSTGKLLDVALGLSDEALDLLDRLIDGDEGLRDEVLARADELVAYVEETGLLSPEQLEQLRDAQGELESFIGDAERLSEARTKLADERDTLAQQRSQLESLPAQARELAEGMAQLSLVRPQIDQARAGLAQIEQAQTQLEAGRAALAAGQAELDERRAAAEAQLADAAEQLDDAERQADDGQAELDDSRTSFEEQKADALAKIAEARAKIDDLDAATWYVQDRSAISSYASIESDASSIEVIGTVFPAIFLTVAILVSLTTATRMVEEERGLIGLYKALGYTRGTIMAKYVSYTVAAAVVGGIVGSVLGFVALPAFLFQVFAVMYTLPAFTLHVSWGLCALACGMFVVGIGVATALTVRGELAEQPASLMRPRAPKAGTRIFLERVGFVWRRLSFLNKVTARNLFRYKRRLAMTVFGVAGCCALMICGFAIADTVLALTPNQYGAGGRAGIWTYDLLSVTQPADLEDAARELTASPEVEGYVAVRTENVTVEHDGAKETVQLIVVPNGFSLDGYVRLVTEGGQELALDAATAGADGEAGTADDGVLVTKNASVVLGFGTGDELSVQDTALRQASMHVDGVVMNYLGNAIYLTQATYERLFGCTLEANALMARLAGTDEEQIAFAEGLGQDSRYLAVTSVAEGVRDFETNFMLINYVVVLITALAAGLSFVVLFTLSTTNISERERELATIKVLGFRRGEVRTYVNKELLILAAIGTVVGIPAGTLLGHALTYVLNMPSMYFAVEIAPMSYVWSCGMSMLFAVVVCLITNRALDRVDMVGALKSAE